MVKLLSDICLNIIYMSLDKIPDIGHYLPTVYKEMLIERLGWHDMLTLDYLPFVSRQLFTISLRRINFYKCEQVNDTVLKLLEAAACKLEFITINQCQNITDNGIQCCTRNQDELVSVKFRKLKHLTDVGLRCIQSPALRVADFKDCAKLSFEGVRTLCERNPTIGELYLSGVNEVQGNKAVSSKSLEHTQNKHDNIVNIAYYLGHNLEILDTQLNQMCNDCLIALATYCPNMKSLNLHGSSRISGSALTKFSMGCTSLEKLDLSFCSSLCSSPSNEALWTLPTSLTDLSLSGVQLKDERIFVECLQRLRNLRAVKLCGVLALTDATLEEVLQHIGHSLTALDLSGGMTDQLSDLGLSAIAEHCFRLEELKFRLLPNINCKELLPMFKDPVRASKFKTIFLSVRELNPDVLHEVSRLCHNLEKLDLSGLACVDDDTLFSLAENCPRLEQLNIKSCRKVSDYGVCELARCCPLRSIVLAGINKVTDKSIFALANSCHYLEDIYLNGCAQVSPTSIRYLMDCTIPRLFYKHATPNAAPNQLMARNLDTGEFCRADLINTEVT
ncbi:F-box/LRR-repeat protein fbxl-1-like [Mercenaria mercenaria]|uniref:F-box/LRR-repeat protein fbxl-1-like n=1 Tax=Mercenaria mercenaria TaxID=6596 RepID=UPI00234F8776|nr:F-box/LRR-repeat protein fbxl-1-like [Mercenaria mercenaria]XP_045190637.2 F-box/LRR-repeat protein fbxl-1-like [Mercenaria mercenaria]